MKDAEVCVQDDMNAEEDDKTEVGETPGTMLRSSELRTSDVEALATAEPSRCRCPKTEGALPSSRGCGQDLTS
jgi:hypothetical protein